MATWQQLKDNVGRSWDYIRDGWQQFSERASDALTRFIARDSHDDHSVDSCQSGRRSSGWGILAAEVFDDSRQVVVRLEVPGLDAEGIDLQVVDDMLVVRGEKRLQREKNEGRYHILECAYGSFERAIPLPVPVNPDRARASYKRGVLRVELPKRGREGSRGIHIHVA